MIKGTIIVVVLALTLTRFLHALPVDVGHTGLNMSEIFENYGSTERATPTFVKVGIFIRDIEMIDETAMKWSIHLTFTLHWSDYRLQFNINDENFTSIIIPESIFHRLWVPKLFLADDKEIKYKMLLNDTDVKLRASQNGNMMLTAKVSLNMGCLMEFSNFPFDTQICGFKISYNYNPKDNISVSWINSDPVQVSKNLHLPNFAFIKHKSSSCKFYSDDGNTFTSCLSVECELGREVSFYQSNVYVPSITAILMTWLSLFLDPLGGAIARAIILGSSVIIGTFVGYLCKVPALYPTALGRWTVVCQMFLLVAVLEFVVVNRLAARQQNQQCFNPAPAPKTGTVAIRPNNRKNENNPKLYRFIHDREWHTTVDVLFRVNYLLAFLVFNLRYYFTFVKQPDFNG